MQHNLRILFHLPTASYGGAVMDLAKATSRETPAEVVIYSTSRRANYPALEAEAKSAGLHLFSARDEQANRWADLRTAMDAMGISVAPHETADITWKWLQEHRGSGFDAHLSAVQHADPTTWNSVHGPIFTRHSRINKISHARSDLIIDYLDIDLFITCSEALDYQSACFINAMKARSKRSVFVPLSVPSVNELDGWLEHNDEIVIRDLCQQEFARRYHQWERRIWGRSCLRQPLGKALAFELAGMAGQRPWLSFSQASDVLVANSRFLRDRLITMGEGHRADQILLAGSADDDRLADTPSCRRKLRAELGLDPDRKVLLLVLCADLRRQYPLPEFKDFWEMVEYWIGSANKLHSFQVIVSPHPWFSLTTENRSRLESLPFKIVWRKVADLQPAADVVAAFGASSTPRLAAAAGLPVLNYLCFDARFEAEDNPSYFVGFPSMPVARNRREWEELLRRIDDPGRFAELAAVAEQQAAYFGKPDGHFGRRLGTICRTLARGRGPLQDDELTGLKSELAVMPSAAEGPEAGHREQGKTAYA